ncbi:amidohydrolase family protein [Nocardioides sp. YIM 152588]|uniref:amidohydrolase family protein n=1 Tax=Nocardioides sp. YIM 152588 TaxID=3158259 RepID=UPI0032E39BAA
MTEPDLGRPSLGVSAPGGGRPAAITDVTVWTGTGWRERCDVVLADGVVTDLRDHRPGAAWAGEALDGSGGHLVPGFTNTHTHLQQSLCRGVGEGQPLLAWLLTVGEGMKAVTPRRAYVAAVAAALEGLLSGTTTLVEHAWPHRDDAVGRAVQEALDLVGVRAVLGIGVADRPDPTRRWGFEPSLMKPLDEVFAGVDELGRRTAGGRLTPALAVPNPRSLTPDGMKRVRAFAEERGLTAMIHLAETGTDDAMCREHAGVGAVELLAQSDFLWDRLLAVHCVEVDDAMIAALAAHDVAVAWNPVSNMRLGSGVAPVEKMLAAGVRVGIGVDGAASNDRQDMLETLRAGAYVQRATDRRADMFGHAEMLALACDGAAATLGQRVGAAAPGGVGVGRPADLTLVRFGRDFACLPVTDPGASLLTTGTPRIVDTVLVDGEVVVADGRSTRVDVEALTRELAALPPG